MYVGLRTVLFDSDFVEVSFKCRSFMLKFLFFQKHDRTCKISIAPFCKYTVLHHFLTRYIFNMLTPFKFLCKRKKNSLRVYRVRSRLGLFSGVATGGSFFVAFCHFSGETHAHSHKGSAKKRGVAVGLSSYVLGFLVYKFIVSALQVNA